MTGWRNYEGGSFFCERGKRSVGVPRKGGQLFCVHGVIKVGVSAVERHMFAGPALIGGTEIRHALTEINFESRGGVKVDISISILESSWRR